MELALPNKILIPTELSSVGISILYRGVVWLSYVWVLFTQSGR